MEPREQSKHVEGVMGQQKLVGSVGTATQPPKPGQHTSNRARGRAQKLDSHVGAVTEGWSRSGLGGELIPLGG